jgi:hexosaminidase
MVRRSKLAFTGWRNNEFDVNLNKQLIMIPTKDRTGKNKDIFYRYLSLVLLSLFGLSVFFNGYSQKSTHVEETAPHASMSLLPVPKKTSFSGQVFRINDSWVLETGSKLTKDDPSVQSLITGLKERGGIKINTTADNGNPRIRINVRPGSVTISGINDTANDALKDQAYRLKMDASEISINANAPAGLFYGVQTLLQLVRKEKGRVILPEGEISDWPDLELRIIFWDCSHHLERMEEFKRIIRQAAYYKINAIALKLEGHFQYESAKPIIEPYAFTPAEYQELTDYAVDHFIQLIPYLDAPAHVSFILKHPEYAGLRALPNSNYEMSVVNQGTYELISNMFMDLMDASKGGKYILLSTDEPYYVGKTEGEKDAARVPGGNGKLLADFITRISGKLHERGRTAIFWGEFPLTISDISALPSYLVNGEYNEKWAPEYRKKGIRQLIYISTQGEEPLFPNYYHFSPEEKKIVSGRVPANNDAPEGRVQGLINGISSSLSGKDPDIMGVIVAAWSDAGLNPEAFWLGYSTGASAAWNNTLAEADDLTSRFFRSFYGPGALNIEKVYRLMSTQAEFYNLVWDMAPSELRTPIMGNSEGIYETPKPALDKTLPPLPLPSVNDLSVDKDWSMNNRWRIDAAKFFLKENNELTGLLEKNIRQKADQKYNLEVFLSIASLCRQNLNMLLGLDTISSLLKKAAENAKTEPVIAVGYIDMAIRKARTMIIERDSIFNSLTSLWYLRWYPLATEANGRRFLFQVDDIKDHLPGRTTDLSYLIYPALNYHLEDWITKIITIRKSFAKNHNLFLQ